MERRDGYVFASLLTPKQDVAVANLVGKMCKVSCVLNGVPVEALWDTGAQVSVALKSWLGEYLPSLKPRNFAELLGDETGLNLILANGGPLPFDGLVEVQLQLNFRYSVIHPTHSSTFGCKRRFGVIGYNVIEEVIKGPYQWEKTAQRPLERL